MMSMHDSGLRYTPYEIATERAALAPKIAAHDARLREIDQEIADFRRAHDPNKAVPKRIEVLRGEREKLVHARAALHQRDNDLRIASIHNQRRADELQRKLDALDAELMTVWTPAMREAAAQMKPLLYTLMDGFGRQPDGVSQHNRARCADLARVCEAPAELLARREALETQLAEVSEVSAEARAAGAVL